MQDNDIITGEALGEKLLESVRQMKAGQGTVVYAPAQAARQRTGLSQARFAELLGVSVRTLQEWEQGRRQPSGAARTLFKVAARHLVR
jgi:putative transcriptional regulator